LSFADLGKGFLESLFAQRTVAVLLTLYLMSLYEVFYAVAVRWQG